MTGFSRTPRRQQTDGNLQANEGAILAELTERIWQDLDRKLPRAQVRQAVLQEAAAFHQGIQTNLIHRRIRVKLIKETKEH